MWNSRLSRLALAALAIVSLGACGSREPATDAERLARGRELVQQMSTRLAAVTALSVTTCGPTYYTRVSTGYQVVVLK